MARQRAAKKIDTTRWALTNASFLAFSAGIASVTLLGSFSTVVETIMRTWGELLAFVDGASAPGKLVRIGVGFILGQSGQGTTVLTSPLTDGQGAFFWYEVFTLGYEEMVTDVIDVPGISSYRVPIDSKAMRTVRPDQEVQCVVENITIGSAAAVNILVNARILLGH